MAVIRVILADDHAILRDSMRAFLSLHSDMQIVGEASNGIETITQVLSLEPDVLLLDIAMPNLSGLEVVHRIKRDLPACKIVILSQHYEPDTVLPILRAGVDGYILKKAGGNDVVEALRAVYHGDSYLHPAVAHTVLEMMVRGGRECDDPLAVLSQREREVLALIAEGKTNQQIASLLSISTKTVDKHRANLIRKLQVDSRAELIHFALKHGLHP